MNIHQIMDNDDGNSPLLGIYIFLTLLVPYRCPVGNFTNLMIETRAHAISVKLAPNVMMWSCQLDEDVVGRTSRLSRRVNIRRVAQRSLDRFLVAAHTAHVKEKLLA